MPSAFSLSHCLLLTLLSSLLQTTTTAAAAAAADGKCGKLTTPSTHCPDVTYDTTIQDTAKIDKEIQESLNYIGSQGYDKADTSCIIPFRQALCFQKFIKCDPATGNIQSVCKSVRQDALEKCSEIEGFHDTAPLMREFGDGSRYGDPPDCFPNNNPVPEEPIVEKETDPAPGKPVAEKETDPVSGKPVAEKKKELVSKKTVVEEEKEPVPKPPVLKKEEGSVEEGSVPKEPVVETVENAPATIEESTAPKSDLTPTEKDDAESVKPPTERNCANSDLEVTYGICSEEGTREMKFAIKKDANCADPWKLTELPDLVACDCKQDTLAKFMTTCSERNTQNRLWYHQNLLPFTSETATAEKPWPCDRRRGLPPMESDVACVTTKDEVPNETLSGKNSLEISWNKYPSEKIRTGLQRVECTNPPLNGPAAGDPTVKCPSDPPVDAVKGYTGWAMKELVAHSDALPPGVLSYLELDVTTSADAKSPSLLFTYSVTSAPHFYGLRFLLDQRIAMPLTSNQTELTSYAVALEPGKVHVGRWEYLTGPNGWEVMDTATGEENRAVLQNVYLANADPHVNGAPKQVVEEQEDASVPTFTIASVLLLCTFAVGGVAYFSRRKRRRKDLGGFVGVEYASNGDREFALLRGKNEARGSEENLEMESFDVFGDSDNEFDQEDNDSSSNHSSEPNDRLNNRNEKSYPAPATPFLDIESDEEALVGAGVGTG